ncbi:MAG: HipA N-terminal domain-containing protein [Bacteroidota bacterium]
MRQANVWYKQELAGLLTQHDDGSFSFVYFEDWLKDNSKPGVSLTLPKGHSPFSARYLFPFFVNLLPEGSNKEWLCKAQKIDLDDDFGVLMISAKDDPIGAIQIQKIEQG